MTDQNEQDPTVEERITEGTDAHLVDPTEDPEEHIGEVLRDPWEDPHQTDWPNAAPIELDGGPTSVEV